MANKTKWVTAIRPVKKAYFKSRKFHLNRFSRSHSKESWVIIIRDKMFTAHRNYSRQPILFNSSRGWVTNIKIIIIILAGIFDSKVRPWHPVSATDGSHGQIASANTSVGSLQFCNWFSRTPRWLCAPDISFESLVNKWCIVASKATFCCISFIVTLMQHSLEQYRETEFFQIWMFVISLLLFVPGNVNACRVKNNQACRVFKWMVPHFHQHIFCGLP